jgi:hypothetical protein
MATRAKRLLTRGTAAVPDFRGTGAGSVGVMISLSSISSGARPTPLVAATVPFGTDTAAITFVGLSIGTPPGGQSQPEWLVTAQLNR